MNQVRPGNRIGWTNEEFSEIEFGDKRLKVRFLKIAQQFSKKSEAPINQACEDWADTKAAYRFFNNKKVGPEKIISEHCKRTKIRAEYLNTILANRICAIYLILTTLKQKGFAISQEMLKV